MDKRSSYSIIAIATIMMGAMLFSSCSHDEFYYSEEKVESLVNEKYAAAFEKAFGKVGPNVDWGFSSKRANTRGFTRTGEEVFEPTITFPEDYNDNLFFADVPDGVNKASGSEVNGGVWYIDGTFQQFAMRLVGTIYVKGTVDLSVTDGFEVNAGTKIYLVNGATLKIGPSSAWNLKGDIYIADGATLETSNTTEILKINSGAKVYTQKAITTQNGGIIKVKDLEVNSTSILYNSGTIIATNGTVSAESNSSRIVNNGVIDCKDVVVNAGAVRNFLNWNVTGTTYINTSNSGWINNGQWTTYDFTYVSGSKNVINNCHLKVNNDFYINLSSLSAVNEANIGFKINSGGSVETQYFTGGRTVVNGVVTGGPFRISMAESSLFKVEKTAILESSRGPISDNEVGFGFFGPSTGGYAVFQAKDIIRDETLAAQKNHGAVTYGGNLYVSAETHFAQGYDSDGSGSYTPRPFIYEQGGFSINSNIFAAGFNSGKPSITIGETGCSPGFQGGDPLYRVIAEDLSADQAGDFDFNDVVFDVVKYDQSKNMTTLRLQACGGTLPLKIGSTKGEGGIEVHSLYGETAPDPTTGLYKMWNTSPSVNKHDPVDFEITGQYITPEQLLTLRIEVQKNGEWMLLTATKGVAACKILVDDRFTIVPERKSILDDYGNFTNYVQGNWTNENGLDDFWWVQN